jgi:hypothetical protein
VQRSQFRCRIEPPEGGEPVWKSMVIDPASGLPDTKPPFAQARHGSPPYHGHPLLEETRHGGWCLGAITDPFEADCEAGCTIGDAFVEAPDGGRAGLVWVLGDEPKFAVIRPPDLGRWGVFHFTVLRPIAGMADLREAFAGMLPALEQLRERYRTEPPPRRPWWRLW